MADVLAAKQTFRMQDAIGQTASALFAVEALVAAGTAFLAIAVLRKGFRRQKRPFNGKRRLEIVGPLRRLFVSVLS